MSDLQAIASVYEQVDHYLQDFFRIRASLARE